MIDEEDVRGLVATADIPPPPVGVAEVVEAGQRIAARWRTTGTAGAACLAVILVAATVSVLATRSGGRTPVDHPGVAAPLVTATPLVTGAGNRPSAATSAAPPTRTCAATALKVPGRYTDVSADVIDPAGRYIAGHATVGEDFVPILWTDGVPRLLPIHAQSVQVSSVNAQGVAVGVMYTNHYRDQEIFRYQTGVVTILSSPVAKTWNLYPVPYINAAGVIMVNAEPPHESGGTHSIVVEWAPGETTGRILSMPVIDDVLAIGDNVLAGGSYPDGPAGDAIVWDLNGGNPRTLRAPDGSTAVVYGVAGHFAVGGVWEQNGSGPGAILWDLDVPGYIELPLTGPLMSVNAKGWTLDGTRVYLGGPVAALGLLAGVDATEVAGTSIADNGTVVGGIGGAHGSVVPVIWHC